MTLKKTETTSTCRYLQQQRQQDEYVCTLCNNCSPAAKRTSVSCQQSDGHLFGLFADGPSAISWYAGAGAGAGAMSRVFDILLQRCDVTVPWGFAVGGGFGTPEHAYIAEVASHTLGSFHFDRGDKILQIQRTPCDNLGKGEIEQLINDAELELQIMVQKVQRSPEYAISVIYTSDENPNGWRVYPVAEPQPNKPKPVDEWATKTVAPSGSAVAPQWVLNRKPPVKNEVVPDWRRSANFGASSDEEDEVVAKTRRRKSTQEGQGPAPPPPPGLPGSLPTRRLQTEIPERGAEPPAAIQNAMMTKDKKPFTYTPGGLNLSEIKSPRMARRLNRNAHADEIHGEHAPAHQPAPQGPLPPAAAAAMQTAMPTQVFPTGPPPPPPPPQTFSAPPPPPPSFPPPVPPGGQEAKTLPKIRGFDPNEILTRASRLQPHAEPPRPAPAPAEPGTAYGPSRAQLGTIYIPPVSSPPIDSPTPSSTSSFSPRSATPDRPAPWSSQKSLNQQPASPLSQQSPSPQPPHQIGTRIIPIQVEGRESSQYSPSLSQQQNQYQQQQQHQYQQQQSQYQQQQNQYQPQPSLSQQSKPGGRVIPIQIEGAVPKEPQRPKYNPSTPSSPTPYAPPTYEGAVPPAPQWAPVQARGRSQDQPDRGSFLPPLGPPNAPEYGAYNTAGVPLSALRKMQLSDDDKALMDKLKTQADNGEGPSGAHLYKGSHIPSRVFKILDESVDDENYLHREVDPRYRGAAIPSRAFRMLQTMTDTAGEVPRGPSRGPPSRPPSANPYQQPEPGTPQLPASEQQAQEPRKYTGGSIPSRSFRMLQAMTGQEPPARGGISPSGRETPVARWCPSPSPMDPYAPWGYYPPDPYAYYNFLYGYPPPPPPPPPFRFPGYLSDTDENGYSSTDELGQYYQNYRRNMAYANVPPKMAEEVPEVKPEEEEEEEESEEGSEEESVSSSEEDTDTDDTEIEEEKEKKLRKSTPKIKTLKSVSDVKIYTSESTATVTNDEWEDCESKLGDEDQEESEEEEEEEEEEDEEDEEEEEEFLPPPEPEEIIPHQLSVIFEESEASDVESLRRAAKSIETDSTMDLEDVEEEVEEEEEDDDEDLVSQSSVTVRLPLKFNRDEEVTTVTVGDSEVKEEEVKEEEDADVSFTFSIPTRSNSVVTVLSTESKVVKEETEEEVTVSVSLPKKKTEEVDKTEYEKSVGKLEEMISSILESTEKQKLDKKDSIEESEEDDSGVTSDMSTKPPNSDTESEYSELSKMTQYQRASTHSRLFKLLQEECEKEDEEEVDEDEGPVVHFETVTERKEKLTLPLHSSEAESQSSSSGVTSPSSPTVTDRLVKELIQSLLHKKKGKKFRKLPMAKLHAAALRILQEDMDPYDTSSASASGDDGFTMSPVRHPHSPLQQQHQQQPPPGETIYGENYYDYLDYYNSWGPPQGYYAPPPPEFAFPYHGYKPKCPRLPPAALYHQQESPELSLTFSEKRDRVAKVLDKGKS